MASRGDLGTVTFSRSLKMVPCYFGEWGFVYAFKTAGEFSQLYNIACCNYCNSLFKGNLKQLKLLLSNRHNYYFIFVGEISGCDNIWTDLMVK